MEEAFDDKLVVVASGSDKLKWYVQAVEKAVDVGDEDLDVTSCMQQFGDLHHGHEVAAMRSAGCSGTPVDLERSFLVEDDIIDNFGVENLGQVGLDEGKGLFWRHGRGRDPCNGECETRIGGSLTPESQLGETRCFFVCPQEESYPKPETILAMWCTLKAYRI